MDEAVKRRETSGNSGLLAVSHSLLEIGVRKFHKDFTIPHSQKLIFQGLACDYPPLNAYVKLRVDAISASCLARKIFHDWEWLNVGR